ncbi:hypothetical protein GCM10027578_22200 [Spirosoma luteolum]
MAFATGHNPRSGFVAGQLRDGDSFGTIDVANFGGQAVKFKLDIRYYKNQLFVIGSRLSANGQTEIEKPTVVSKAWLQGVNGAAMPNKIQALTDLITLAPSDATMASLGVKDAQVMPTYPTNELIPFEQNADGFVKAFVSAADQAKAQADAQKQQTTLLNQLTSAVTGNTAGGTSTGGTGTAAGMSMTVKIVIGVVVAAVVGGIIYMATKKKKGGGRK